jgi:hypothetical protein
VTFESPEENRRQQVKIRAPETLVEAYDAAIEADSRNEAICEHMREVAGGESGELDVPDDDDLAAAYRALVNLARADWVTLGRARSRVQEATRYGQRDCWPLLQELADRGYLKIQQAMPGQPAETGKVFVREVRR